MRFLVTGGAGFIGSHIVDALVRNGDDVVVLDNLSYGKEENLEVSRSKIRFIKGDIRDKKVLAEAIKDIDYVLHQAALRSVPKSLLNPELYNDVNINGTLNVLTLARDAKVRRVVVASSSSVYGNVEEFPEREDMYPCLMSPYGLTKLAGEFYSRVFSVIYGLETVNLRYFNVFGPRQSLESEYAVVVPKFITCMLKDKPPPIEGDGRQSRDFTYVTNVVQANIKAATVSGIKCEVLNIACGKAYTVLDIVGHLNKILGKDIKPVFVPPRPGDARATLADISKAARLIGFKPDVDFEEGLKRTVKYFSSILMSL